jgi:hypothetical protein
MFKLADRRGGNAGLYCGPEGLFLGPRPLITRVGPVYRSRAEDEIAALLAAAYGVNERAERHRTRMSLIRAALREGNICRAMILAVQAGLGPVAPDGMARLARLEARGKANFNPDEPRDRHGRWTAEEEDPPTVGSDASEPPALVPVQELLPFAARPPLFLEEPPETVRPFKEMIPRLSGKKAAKDAPSWARGRRPYVGEKGRDFAKRLMDERYGRGNWTRRSDEYRKIQKYGDRAFRDPHAILLPDEDDGQ